MGFPKPWPTDWPEPGETDPNDHPDENEDEQDDERETVPGPEYRQRFYSVTWAINHACNLRCTHCYDAVQFKRKDLSTADALRLIDRLHDAGVTFVAFSGGEAFLRKDVFELMAYCKEQGMQIGARSNGTRITSEVAQRLKQLDIAVVGVSFDGATDETHDAVRGKGEFQAALAGLKALRKEGIRAQMEVVLSRQNAHEALKFVDLGEMIDASEVNFSTMAPQGRALQRQQDILDHELWITLTETLRAASRHSKMPVTPNCAFVGTCFANIEPHITCDGWMTPCYLSPIKLFRVLDTSGPEIRNLLRQGRMRYQDVCGRKAWLQKAEDSLVFRS